jgi:hypothetical protein
VKPWQAYLLGAVLSVMFVGLLTWLSWERPPSGTELGFWTGGCK